MECLERRRSGNGDCTSTIRSVVLSASIREDEPYLEQEERYGDRPDIPITVIVSYIVPFLRRPEWNAMSLANKELYRFLWESHKVIPPWPHARVRVDNAIISLAVSPDNGTVAFGDRQGRVYLMDSRKGHIVNVGEGHFGDLSKLCFSPNGAWLASAGADRSIVLWDLVDYRNPYRSTKGLPKWEKLLDGGHTDAITSLVFSLDSSMLISGGYDRIIRLWDVQTGRQLECPQWTTTTFGYIRMLEWSPEIHQIKPITAGSVRARSDIYSYSLVSVEMAMPAKVWNITISSTTNDTKTPTTTSKQCSTPRLVQSCECTTFGDANTRIQSAAFGPSGDTLVVLCQDSYLQIWDIATQQCKRTIPLFGDASYLSPTLHPQTSVLQYAIMTPNMNRQASRQNTARSIPTWCVVTATTKTMLHCAGTEMGENKHVQNSTNIRHPKMRRRSKHILSREQEIVQSVAISHNRKTVFAAIGGSLSGPNSDAKYLCFRDAP